MKIAVVTPLLPESTGIAEFSEKVYNSDRHIDLFWKKTRDHYAINELFGMAANKKYDAIIFTLGNSNHNYQIVETLEKFKGFPGVKTKIVLHLHDPVLTNVSRHLSIIREGNYLEHYFKRDGLKDVEMPDIYKAFEVYGYTGLSYLINRCNISSIITNSYAAMQLTQADLKEKFESIRNKCILFHPCFDKYINKPLVSRKYDVGVFGVMDNGGKMTNKAFEAILYARNNGYIKSVVMCGYNAREYCQDNGIATYDFVRIIDNPTHAEMHNIMSETKVALQPRLLNTGESSGIVPMLISTNTLSVVSNVGTFQEYPEGLTKKVENVNFVLSANELFSRIDELQINKDRAREYVLQHSPERFLHELKEHLSKLI